MGIKCNSDEKETDGLKITEAGFYELALYGQANLESGDIARIDIMKSSGGARSSIATAFSHAKNAWQDSGVKFSGISLPINSHGIYLFEEGDSLWLDAKVTPNNRQMKNNINLILVKLDSKTLSSCTVETPVSSTLVKLASCSVDTNQSVQDGHFTAPSDGVYKVVYNGLMKVEGAGKVRANILKKTVEGKFKTQVAGFTKMSS